MTFPEVRMPAPNTTSRHNWTIPPGTIGFRPTWMRLKENTFVNYVGVSFKSGAAGVDQYEICFLVGAGIHQF